MTEREVSSERVSEERLKEFASHFADTEIGDLLSELVTLRSSVKTVGVKKLEWSGDEAVTPFGKYRVERTDDGYSLSFEYAEMVHIGFNSVRGFESPRDEAVKYAQADYERRILSAIEAPAAPSEVTEDRVILGAQKVFELFCGKPIDWSAEDIDSPESLLHSADWAQAIAYSRAALKGGK